MLFCGIKARFVSFFCFLHWKNGPKIVERNIWPKISSITISSINFWAQLRPFMDEMWKSVSKFYPNFEMSKGNFSKWIFSHFWIVKSVEMAYNWILINSVAILIILLYSIPFLRFPCPFFKIIFGLWKYVLFRGVLAGVDWFLNGMNLNIE